MAALKGVKTIDMKNGEITKVSYEGSEYERVEGDAKVGDLVLCADGSWCDATIGEFYLVDDVDEKYLYYSDVYTLFRKKHTRLKVGDYAKVVDDSGQDAVTKGDFVKITEDDETTLPFKCDVVIGKSAGGYVWARESDLVHATEAEVTAVREAEDKRSVEAKWAKIGRRVGEYKVGDIVAYDDTNWFGNSGIGEVSEGQLLSYQVRIAATDSVGFKNEYYLNKGRVTLITPVEARFDRS
ncbi:hypothetical protein [Bacillus sp. FSL K6-2971]|uniref:hypothetical protein n=1 Tax=Bacillus sp. FSL K6-2971 TaxID=2921487 RepID=UPI0030F89B5A